MIPTGAIKYTIYAAIMVVSIVIGLRMIFAHELRREDWRSSMKRFVYMSRPRFKVVTIVAGWLLLFLGLYVAYLQVIRLMNH